MVYRNTQYPDYLMHYGVKGMKWGIRRTAAQLGHVVSSGARRVKSAVQTASQKRKAKKQAKQDAKDEETRKIAEDNLNARKEAILKSRSAKQLYENADLFTTQELQSAYNRLVLERNIASLTPQEKSKGQKLVDAYINNGEKVAKVLGTTNKMITNAKRFKDLVSGTDTANKSKKSGNDKKDDNSSSNNSKKKKRGETTIGSEARNVAQEAARDFARDFSDLGKEWFNEQKLLPGR